MPPIYLDTNATTPIASEVAAAMWPYLKQGWGNPSSGHWYGREAARAVSDARSRVAGLLGCATQEIVFTSGGSEANNMALRGVASARKAKGRHIVSSAIEHPAIIQVCDYLTKNGFEVTLIAPDRFGRLDVASLEQAMTDQTILVSVMHANNEVGTIQPVAELVEVAHRWGAVFHTDAAQSVGKIPVEVEELGVDLLSLAGHKFYGPKGVGALYVRSGVVVERLIHGADHESGRRAGTENVLGLVGVGKAAEIAHRDLDKNARHMSRMRNRLQAKLESSTGPRTHVHGHPQQRLPNTLSIGFEGLNAQRLVDVLADKVAISAGAACHGGDVQISAVLQAMSVPIHVAMGTVRISTGRETSPEDIDQASEAILAGADRVGFD